MSSGLDMPQLSTTACAGSYSHPSPSVVPETPNANISYSQQILPVLPSSSVPRIVPSNTSTSLIRGTPATIGLFRARKSLPTLPPYTSPFPYHNYALNFTVRSPVPTQNMLVQTEVSTEDGGEGEQVGEEEEEDEERVERDEAKLVLEVARAQRKVCRTEQQLSIAKIEETDALGNLYWFRAEDAERKLNHAEFDLGHVRHSIQKNGVSLCDLPSTRKHHRMSDNRLTSMVTLWITPFLSHNLYSETRHVTDDEEDRKVLCKAIPVSFGHIPPYALVRLITFGTMCSKSYVFCGGKEYASKQIQDMLGLSSPARAACHPGQPMPQQALGTTQFLLPMQQVEFQLTGILKSLQCDPWPVANDKRARIMLFAGGPATEGPGMVVSNELKEPICSHYDIERDSVKHYKHAVKLYEGLAKRASNNGYVVDPFTSCLDQVGLLEMKSLPNFTNGVIVLSDWFATSNFQQSFLHIFNKDDQDFLEMGFNATFDVQTTKELKVSGLIGHVISAGKKLACVGETEISEVGSFQGGHMSENFKTERSLTVEEWTGQRLHLQMDKTVMECSPAANHKLGQNLKELLNPSECHVVQEPKCASLAWWSQKDNTP
ncbi:hypothetical protein BKA83DRAFT_4536640 [Pisolithus microcarpus]|nr:hypothetical protein BKA83DRAFT_4536640 [Pisolithus microcarpus]